MSTIKGQTECIPLACLAITLISYGKGKLMSLYFRIQPSKLLQHMNKLHTKNSFHRNFEQTGGRWVYISTTVKLSQIKILF